jgi:hypothetical protein
MPLTVLINCDYIPKLVEYVVSELSLHRQGNIGSSPTLLSVKILPLVFVLVNEIVINRNKIAIHRSKLKTM